MSRNLFAVVLSSLFCLAAATAAADGEKNADSKGQSDSNLVLHPMTIRGEGENDPMQHPSLPSPSLDISASQIDREEIELQGASTLSDALKFMPGAHTESRGRKVKQFTSFRGQLYPYPDYAINGIWQREFLEMPYIFPAVAIESVEVQRSGAALMNGLADIEGVINIVPRRFEERETIFDTEYGTHNHLRSSLVTGDSSEKSRYTIGVNHISTDGPEGRNAAERMNSFFGSGGLQAAPKLQIEGYAFGLSGMRELEKPDPDGPAADSYKERSEEYDPMKTFSSGVRALYEGSANASTELKTFYTWRSFDYERKDFRPTKAEEEDYEYGLGIMQSLRLTPNNTLRFGGLYNHWVAPNGKRFYNGSRQDRETFSAVLSDEITFDRLLLDGTLRYARTYNNQYGGEALNITGQRLKLETVSDEWDDPVMVAAIGAKYILQPKSALYFHIAGGKHQPRAGAVIEDGSQPDDERRLMLDAGVSGENSFGSLKLGGFAAVRDDVSVLTSSSATNSAGEEFFFSANENIRQYGIEMEAQSQPIGDILSIVFNATVMNSRKEDSNGDWSDYKEIPNLILGGGLYSILGRWDANIFGKYVSKYENKRFAADNQYHDLGDYLDLGASLGYSLGADRRTRIYCSVENMLDDEYSTVVGWSNDGAKLYAGIRHIF